METRSQSWESHFRCHFQSRKTPKRKLESHALDIASRRRTDGDVIASHPTPPMRSLIFFFFFFICFVLVGSDRMENTKQQNDELEWPKQGFNHLTSFAVFFDIGGGIDCSERRKYWITSLALLGKEEHSSKANT